MARRRVYFKFKVPPRFENFSEKSRCDREGTPVGARRPSGMEDVRMTRSVVAGVVSAVCLVLGFAPTAEADDSCEAICNYGVCGPCNLWGWQYNCYYYNGCGGRYDIPVAPPKEEPQSSAEPMSSSEELLMCTPRQGSEARASIQG
jgi:hypothetical protein